MVDTVRPLKVENPATGGTQTDSYPTAVNPAQDYMASKGLAIEDDTTLIDKAGDNQIQFTDTVNGTVKLGDLSGGGVNEEFVKKIALIMGVL